MIKPTATVLRNPRSVPLTESELSKLKSLRTNFKSITDTATSLGLDRVVYDRAVRYGTASFATVQKIRARFANSGKL